LPLAANYLVLEADGVDDLFGQEHRG
jgi:hypothetical protein